MLTIRTFVVVTVMFSLNACSRPTSEPVDIEMEVELPSAPGFSSNEGATMGHQVLEQAKSVESMLQEAEKRRREQMP